MRKILVAALFATAISLAPAANAAVSVVVDGFTLDDSQFGAQTGVHSVGAQSGSSLTGFVNQGGANNGVTFSTTTGSLSIPGGGEATISGDPLIENLTVVFQKAWDKVTFNFDDGNGSFTLLVNGTALFSASPNPGDSACTFCLIGNGQNKFTVAGSGISSLAFTFNPGVGSAKQFRVLGASEGGAVPEPATWAMMVGGLGIVGAALRRRSTKVQFA